MEILRLRPQSILMYIAPTNAGKTYFTTNYLIPAIREELKGMNKPVNVQHISSDNLRREVLGYNAFNDGEDQFIQKNDDRMNYVSEQAFGLLKQKLIGAVSFPVNADFVIIDTTGMAKKFRDEVSQIAYENHYTFQPIIFDYKKRDDYFKHINEQSFSKKIIAEGVKKFKENSIDYTKKKYPNIQKIKTNDFGEIKIEVENKEWYKSFFLPENDDYLVIGDVHQSYDELKTLIEKNGFKIDENDLITE